MVKYFSGILSKFSPGQRVFVICLMVSALIIVTLGPFIIKGYRPDNKELRIRVDRIQQDNISLNNQIYKLNGEIIKNQQECTDRIIIREKEILSQLDQIEKRFTTEDPQKNEMAMERVMTMNPDDTISVEPMIIQSIVDDSKSKQLIADINKMKKGILKRIPNN
jgi:hypothetical protein